MLDILVLFTAFLFGYIYLRSKGGKGLDIDAKFADPSTPQGKKDRIITSLVFLILCAACVFVGVRQYSRGEFPLAILPVLLGAAVYLYYKLIKPTK